MEQNAEKSIVVSYVNFQKSVGIRLNFEFTLIITLQNCNEQTLINVAKSNFKDLPEFLQYD